MGKQLEIECEGKKTTLTAQNAEEMAEKVKAFAEESGLKRFVVKAKDGKKITPSELGSVEKVTLLRTEVAGVAGEVLF